MISKKDKIYILNLVKKHTPEILKVINFDPSVKEVGLSFGDRYEDELVSRLLNEGMPVSKAEYHARGMPEYSEHMTALGKARKDKNLALVRYNTFKKWVDLLQTKEANKRAEMMIK